MSRARVLVLYGRRLRDAKVTNGTRNEKCRNLRIEAVVLKLPALYFFNVEQFRKHCLRFMSHAR